ncbi:hypothetical protein FRB98_008797 [Tulasnella sp. 332]|nr:hypothetical protein FRB98_008797 [Tulasnella sp. 332]
MTPLDDLPAVNIAALVLSLALWSIYIGLFMTFALRKWRTWSLTSLTVVFTLLIFACNLGDTVCTIVVAYRGFSWYPEGKKVYFIRFYARLIDHGWFAVSSSFDNRDAVDAPKFSADHAFLARYNDLSAAVLVIDIAMTWYFTLMICYRLWTVERQNRAAADTAHFEPGENPSDSPTSPYAKIIRVFIQSGMLYSIAEIIFLICMLTGSVNGKYIMNYLISRVMGISTVLILLQLNARTTSRGISGGRLPTGASESFSMPVFRVSANMEQTDNIEDPEIGTKGVSQISTYDNSTGEHLPYSSKTIRGSDVHVPSLTPSVAEYCSV